jgi:hypothetical protein
MPLFSTHRPARLWLAPLLLVPGLIGNVCAAGAAQVGSGQGVNFGQAVINSSCTVTTSDGSIGVRTNRSLITSDSAETGNFTGTRAAATISALSNLTDSAVLKVENPILGGGTAASDAQVKVGTTGATWGAAGEVRLGADGTLESTPVHVRFSTTNNNSRFATGTYTASATVSCYE